MNEELVTDLDAIIEMLQEIQKGLRGELFEGINGEEYVFDFHACIETIEEIFRQTAQFNTKIVMGHLSQLPDA